jgi:hypothetical protein
VPVPDFFFSLELSDETAVDSLVNDLAGSVLRHSGYAPDAVADISAALRDALQRTAAGGAARCDVRFSAGNGELNMAVSSNGADWRATRPLPR